VFVTANLSDSGVTARSEILNWVESWSRRMPGSFAEKSPIKRVDYRKLAFDHWEQKGQVVCAHCGFGIRAVLEVAHLDCNRSNCALENLAILCPNCHKMHDLDLISTETIIEMRDRSKIPVWSKRMKDAGQKAKGTLRKRRETERRRKIALKSVATRQENSRKRLLHSSDDSTKTDRKEAHVEAKL